MLQKKRTKSVTDLFPSVIILHNSTDLSKIDHQQTNENPLLDGSSVHIL